LAAEALHTLAFKNEANPFQKSDDAEIMYVLLMKIIISSEVEDLKLQVKV
jgi:hypothetical protein